MEKKKIEWIYIARGIAIFFVIIGHDSLLPSKKWIYSFHMPLFFFLAGCTYYLSNKRDYIKKTHISLLVPYLFFSIIKLIYFFFFERENIKYRIIGVFLNSKDLYSIGMWFVLCIFVAKIILYFLDKLNLRYRYLILFIVFNTISFLYVHLINKSLIWFIEIVPMAICLMILGIVFMKHKINIKINNNIYLIFFSLCFFFCIEVNYVFSTINNNVEMYDNRYGNVFLFYISAISGIFAIIIFSYFIEKSKFKQIKSILSYLGKNSLYIYCIEDVIRPLFYVVFDKIIIIDNNHSKLIILSVVILRSITILLLSYLPNRINVYFITLIQNKLLVSNTIFDKLKKLKRRS